MTEQVTTDTDPVPGKHTTGGAERMDLRFPKFMACRRCGAICRVNETDTYEMPEGVAGIAWARCRTCRQTFVHFAGEDEVAARLMERWLDVH